MRLAGGSEEQQVVQEVPPGHEVRSYGFEDLPCRFLSAGLLCVLE